MERTEVSTPANDNVAPPNAGSEAGAVRADQRTTADAGISAVERPAPKIASGDGRSGDDAVEQRQTTGDATPLPFEVQSHLEAGPPAESPEVDEATGELADVANWAEVLELVDNG